MRDYRDAKAMARTLRASLKAKSIDITHSETLELIAKTLGFKNWNVLSATIESETGPQKRADKIPITSAQEQSCAFCGKSSVAVKKLIAGAGASICNECVRLCENLLNEEGITASVEASGEPDDRMSAMRVASREDGQKQLQHLRGILRLLNEADVAPSAPESNDERGDRLLASIRAQTPEQRQANAVQISKRIAEIEGALEILPKS